MSVEAISAISSLVGSPMSRPAAMDSFVVPAATLPTAEAAPAPTGSLTETLGSVHDQIQILRPTPHGADAVETQLREMLPSPWVNSSLARTGESAAAKPEVTPADAFKSLEKSYDHAIFVNLVSQVMGGVSHSVSTLIRQS
ncbi:hypothetical protein ABEG18_20045 [Alsobacter sp. KACC 23698]|uniref:Uncharacterized protein n=1 Tax=Alsobacter sp. KACC 23698 TaxID=3149229 RepID=A0AAU7JCG2_9HYPH